MTKSKGNHNRGLLSYLPWRFKFGRQVKRDPLPSIYPLPLPSTRLPIYERPLPQQQTDCPFLHLPPELRQCIYDEVLGGRFIAVGLVASRTLGHCIVHSAYYELPSPDEPVSLRGLLRTDSINTTLLLSCRQVYLEALPTIHRYNTFGIHVCQLETVIASGWGAHCLPDICSLHLYHDYRSTPAPPWSAVFQLLRQMRLNKLVFEFAFQLLEWSELSPQRDVFNTAWGRGVLSMKGLGLRTFRLYFTAGDPPEAPVYRATITDRFCRAIIRPGMEEKDLA
ncbi:hypothetical protein B0H14DRAFT_2837557 [Mycena olivaceomarginata]|nr:hypothetical protein B0H14DRAFT_2837557 [Mycena olivaceomarginata]